MNYNDNTYIPVKQTHHSHGHCSVMVDPIVNGKCIVIIYFVNLTYCLEDILPFIPHWSWLSYIRASLFQESSIIENYTCLREII